MIGYLLALLALGLMMAYSLFVGGAARPDITKELALNHRSLVLVGYERGRKEGPIFVIDIDRSKTAAWETASLPNQVTDQPLLIEGAAWSDAQRSLLLEHSGGRLSMIRLDGSIEKLPAIEGKRYLDSSQISWSHDGNAITYWLYPDAGQPGGLFVRPIQDGTARRIDIGNLKARSPALSGDGTTLAFVDADEHGCSGWPQTCPSTIYRMPASGGPATPMIHGWTIFGPPILRWSPNGQELAILAPSDKHDGQGAIWLTNANGSGTRVLISPAARHCDINYGVAAFDWSPDGNQLAYASDEEASCHLYDARGTMSNFNVYVVNADGTGRKRVAKDFSRISYIFWPN